MITVPKPRFAISNVPIGESLEDYRDHITDLQFHVLGDTIDRVSRRNRDAVVIFPIYGIYMKSPHTQAIFYMHNL